MNVSLPAEQIKRAGKKGKETGKLISSTKDIDLGYGENVLFCLKHVQNPAAGCRSFMQSGIPGAAFADSDPAIISAV